MTHLDETLYETNLKLVDRDKMANMIYSRPYSELCADRREIIDMMLKPSKLDDLDEGEIK